MIRDKIEKENSDKVEKEKKEREENDKKKDSNNQHQDFQPEALKGPDILALLTSLQAKVEELAKDSLERKEREKIQSQYQMWYPHYPQQ